MGGGVQRLLKDFSRVYVVVHTHHSDCSSLYVRTWPLVSPPVAMVTVCVVVTSPRQHTMPLCAPWDMVVWG